MDSPSAFGAGNPTRSNWREAIEANASCAGMKKQEFDTQVARLTVQLVGQALKERACLFTEGTHRVCGSFLQIAQKIP